MFKRLHGHSIRLFVTVMSCCAILSGCSDKSKESTISTEESSTVISTNAENMTEVSSEITSETEEEIPTIVNMENEEKKTEAKVYFNWVSGFYKDEIDLEMFCPVEGSKIYYTLDGSIPNESSTEYTEPLHLSDKSKENNRLCTRTDICVDSQYVPEEKVKKANIIRAIAVFEDGTESPINSGTFFVGLDRKELYGDSPVISLITDESNLFDYEKGIYVLGKTYDEWIKEDPKNLNEPGYKTVGNFSNRGKEWERPVYFEYIDANGKVAVGNDMGLRMKGASTRTYYQKSMRLIAREEYGKKNIKYSIIPSNERSDKTGEVEKYKSFVLRNGGNDTDFGKLRDPFWQTIISDRNVETQQYCPCVVFLDGEYWGLYTIVEDYTDSYFENNYGIDKNEIVVVKVGKVEEGEDEDIHLYNQMFDFITENDMSDPVNYEKASEMLDIQGFAEYIAFNVYIYNHDSIFDNNNWSMWRTRQANNSTQWSDGKWRMLVFDTEFSSGVYSGGREFDQNNLRDILEVTDDDHKKRLDERCPSELFFSLCENENFKHSFINTLCDIRNYDCEKNYAWKVLKDIAPAYKQLAGDSIRRNGPDWVALYQDPDEYYKGRVKELESYIGGRYGAFPNIIKKAYMLENPVNVTINVPSKDVGEIILNNTKLNNDKLTKDVFTGSYFTEYRITLTAKPLNGKKFVKWETENCELSDATSSTVEVTISKDAKINPIFE